MVSGNVLQSRINWHRKAGCRVMAFMIIGDKKGYFLAVAIHKLKDEDLASERDGQKIRICSMVSGQSRPVQDFARQTPDLFDQWRQRYSVL